MSERHGAFLEAGITISNDMQLFQYYISMHQRKNNHHTARCGGVFLCIAVLQLFYWLIKTLVFYQFHRAILTKRRKVFQSERGTKEGVNGIGQSLEAHTAIRRSGENFRSEGATKEEVSGVLRSNQVKRREISK